MVWIKKFWLRTVFWFKMWTTPVILRYRNWALSDDEPNYYWPIKMYEKNPKFRALCDSHDLAGIYAVCQKLESNPKPTIYYLSGYLDWDYYDVLVALQDIHDTPFLKIRRRIRKFFNKKPSAVFGRFY